MFFVMIGKSANYNADHTEPDGEPVHRGVP